MTESRRILATTLGLIALAVVLVLASGLPVHYVGPSDEAGYYAVARSEPSNTLYDGRPYVLHPPLYPIAVRAASLVAGDIPRGALLLGIACNAALVVLAFRIG